MKDILNNYLFILIVCLSITCKPVENQSDVQNNSDKFSISNSEYQILFKAILKSNIDSLSLIGGSYLYFDATKNIEIGYSFTKEYWLDSLIINKSYLKEYQENSSNGYIKLVLECSISDTEYSETSINYYEGVGISKVKLNFKELALLKVVKGKWLRVNVRKEDLTYNLAEDAAWAIQMARDIEIKIN